MPDRRDGHGFVRSLFPILTWLPEYDRSWLRLDIMAGLAVWAMTVPQVLAYAGIAGVPPIYGLYAVPLAMAAYAIFGTSRTLCVGPESAIAIISAVTVGALVTDSPEEFLALTSLLAFVVGVLFLLFGFLRLGWAADFLAQPVLQGFTMGIALVVIVGQAPIVLGTEDAVAGVVGELRNLPEVFGLNIDYNGFVLQTWALLSTLGAAHVATAVIGVASLVLLFAFRRFRPYAPSALIAVILAVGAVSLLDLASKGVRVIGEVETGMVPLALPALSVPDMLALLPGALAIVLLGYSVSLGVAAVGAERTGEEIDANQELVALGMSNIGAAFSSGFVACGSLSRGSVIGRARGRTQVVSLVNAGLVILTLVAALPLFYKLPNATLSAIVIVAMTGLLRASYFRNLYRISSGEFAYGLIALLGVLLLGILQGVALGVILAVGLLIHRVSRPATAVLGRLPGTTDYRDTAAHPQVETTSGLLIFRFDAPVIFSNCGHLRNEVSRLVSESEDPIREVLIAAQQINLLDSTGSDRLGKLQTELGGAGIALSFAEARDSLRETMRRTGLEESIGLDHFHDSIEGGVRAFTSGGARTPAQRD